MSSLSRLSLLTTLIVLQPLLLQADHRRGFNSYGTYGANAWNHTGVAPQFDNHTYGYPGYPGYGQPGYRPPSPPTGGGPSLEATVTQLYATYLGRLPDAEGMQTWTNLIRLQGGTLRDVKLGIISSPECFDRFNRRPTGYVQYLFLQETGRYPNQHELRYWLSRFHSYRGDLKLFCQDLLRNTW